MKIKFLILLIMIAYSYSHASECVEMSQKLFNSEQYQKSIDNIYHCLEDAVESKQENELSELYYGLGINYAKIGLLDSALKYYKLARFTSKNTDNYKLRALINNEIAITYTNLGLNHKSIKFLKSSLELNKKLKRKKGI